MTRQEEDTKRYFVHFCLFFTTFRTKMEAFFFDWTTLKRFFVNHKDNSQCCADRHRHRRDDGKGDAKQGDDENDLLFKYQAMGGREQSDVREESRRRREKDEGEKKSASTFRCCGC